MKLKIREMAIFAMLGTLMFISKVIMAALPNIHLLALLICVCTLRYRQKALYPIYVYVLLEGIYQGFSVWWIPYMYVWTVLWAVIMLLPKNMKPAVAAPVYMTVCGIHGLLFGVLWAPAQAIMIGLSFEGTLSWIAAGFVFDITHGISNFIVCAAVLPLLALLKRIDKQT